MSKKIKTVINVLICIMALVIFISNAISLNSNVMQSTDKTEEFILSFDNQLKRLTGKYNSGLAVALIEDGNIAFTKGYGYADKERGFYIEGDTIFQAASISKSVAAWGVMKLVEEGKIDLDAPAEKYLTSWSIPASKFDKEKVTIRQLLSHTSGLSSHGYAGYEPDSTLPTLEESLLGKGKGLDPVRLIAEPGTAYKYSGGGYTVLQLLIEEVTGIPFSEYMEKEVLIPLGMLSSSYDYKAMQDKASKSYGVFGEALPGYIYTEEAAAGLYITVEDLAKFVAASMCTDNQQKVLKAETIKLMQNTVSTESPFGIGYMEIPLKDGRRALEHRGTNRGWRNKYQFLPDTKDGLVILTNSDMGRNLAYDVEMLWQQAKLGYICDNLRTVKLQRILVLLASVILAGGLLIYINSNIYKIVEYITKNGFNFAIGFRLKPWLLALLSLIIGILWLLLFYTGVFYKGWAFITFMPKGFDYLSITVILWCAAISIINIIKLQINNKNADNIINK